MTPSETLRPQMDRVQRNSLIRAGGFDEKLFFMYCEDEDWCWRVRQAGWRIIYHPDVVAHHRKGSSARTRRFAMIYHWHRSIFLYHRKNIAPRYPALINVPVYGGMAASLVVTLGITGARRLLQRDSAPAYAPVQSDEPFLSERVASASRMD